MATSAGDYGNVLLTRLGVREVTRHDLSTAGREPRGAVDALLETDDGSTVRMVVTHLGLRRAERRRQIERLVPILERHGQSDVLVLAGDLNEWRPVSWVLRRLRRRFGRSRAPRTFPASRPMLALDRIWVQPAESLIELRAHRSPLARQASDHLPLVATIDIAAR
jgi:endonuclease/exonuclease/phosphatase family metal-dependent hydrolase